MTNNSQNPKSFPPRKDLQNPSNKYLTSKSNDYFNLYFGSQMTEDGNSEALYILNDSNGKTNFSGSELVSSNKWYDPDYIALLAALKLASDLGILKLQIIGDSKMIIDQLNGLFCSEDPNHCTKKHPNFF